MPSRSERRRPLCAYRLMWLFAMFDLPVGTQDQRRTHARFRKILKQAGFGRIQLSVYARHCPNEDQIKVHMDHVRQLLPAQGEVRMLAVTDRQFGRMESYFGEKRQPNEAAPTQLMLF